MNRKQADIAAGVLICTVLLLGVLSAVQLQLQDGAMSDRMSSAPVLASLGPVIMSVVVASILTGVYVFVRGRLFSTASDETTRGPAHRESSPDPTAVTDSSDTPDSDTETRADTESRDPATERHLLDVLPDDEQRLLEPVIESPGLTQIELRDRSNYSKSKVSQSVSDLERRGLLYREPQGRTYRVYPADDLDERL